MCGLRTQIKLCMSATYNKIIKCKVCASQAKKLRKHEKQHIMQLESSSSQLYHVLCHQARGVSERSKSNTYMNSGTVQKKHLSNFKMAPPYHTLSFPPIIQKVLQYMGLLQRLLSCRVGKSLVLYCSLPTDGVIFNGENNAISQLNS